MTTNQLSGYNLWVICDHAAYGDFCADIDHIYTDIAIAVAEAQRMSDIPGIDGDPSRVKYWVESLYDAVASLKRDAQLQGERQERVSASYRN